ncbi:FAD-dependent oxidoreductase [Micromonospora narathiwatensis]|uniref:Pyruvate/2-oxoglutarate dehydrogenase complex, dihydrolipoamide dehydrogenase (E3) component n=1 Tax=Micromonospora narathiwatensis TaxID=299146 RepID=A0A1A8ZQP8_9ACTN|nr:FAD-dependent oxidoreductase [Micromonospora narathiwatensis]SBT46449.1 Pyruvate/2-oxoglutarate dehydrogenase complex, dihydrolipoamide dehydrogenase (E3) component [Micromonospora narathiwatensis]
MSAPSVDVAVVGAGPAGLAAALAAAEAGVVVALIDAGVRAGGQYWRSPAPGAGRFTPNTLHHSWRRFTDTTARLDRLADQRKLQRFAEHHVWSVERVDDRWAIHCLVGPEPRQHPGRPPVTIRARRLILATGAYDRQLPFPGWDLPGVLTAGGAQALLKGHLVVAGATAVVAGTGPFLLPVATGLARHGARVRAVVEANTPLGFARAPRALLGAVRKVGEASAYAAQLARHRVAVRHRHIVTRAVGTDRLTGVVVARLGRDGRPEAHTERTVECDLLAVGWGFTPQLDLHLQVGCATRMDVDSSLVVAVDDRQGTTVDGVWAAGESTGIGGADLASIEGAVAGRTAAGSLGVPPDPAALARLLRRRAALRRFAEVMHRVYPVPSGALDGPTDDTLLCRCEEVTVGAVRQAVDDLGATDPRTVKLLARPGMGWCQGRVCGFATVCLTAHQLRRPPTPEDLRAFAQRPIAAPTPLGQLAMPSDEGDPRGDGG